MFYSLLVVKMPMNFWYVLLVHGVYTRIGYSHVLSVEMDKKYSRMQNFVQIGWKLLQRETNHNEYPKVEYDVLAAEIHGH